MEGDLLSVAEREHGFPGCQRINRRIRKHFDLIASCIFRADFHAEFSRGFPGAAQHVPGILFRIGECELDRREVRILRKFNFQNAGGFPDVFRIQIDLVSDFPSIDGARVGPEIRIPDELLHHRAFPPHIDGIQREILNALRRKNIPEQIHGLHALRDGEDGTFRTHVVEESERFGSVRGTEHAPADIRPERNGRQCFHVPQMPRERIHRNARLAQRRMTADSGLELLQRFRCQSRRSDHAVPQSVQKMALKVVRIKHNIVQIEIHLRVTGALDIITLGVPERFLHFQPRTQLLNMAGVEIVDAADAVRGVPVRVKRDTVHPVHIVGIGLVQPGAPGFFKSDVAGVPVAQKKKRGVLFLHRLPGGFKILLVMRRIHDILVRLIEEFPDLHGISPRFQAVAHMLFPLIERPVQIKNAFPVRLRLQIPVEKRRIVADSRIRPGVTEGHPGASGQTEYRFDPAFLQRIQTGIHLRAVKPVFLSLNHAQIAPDPAEAYAAEPHDVILFEHSAGIAPSHHLSDLPMRGVVGVQIMGDVASQTPAGRKARMIQIRMHHRPAAQRVDLPVFHFQIRLEITEFFRREGESPGIERGSVTQRFFPFQTHRFQNLPARIRTAGDFQNAVDNGILRVQSCGNGKTDGIVFPVDRAGTVRNDCRLFHHFLLSADFFNSDIVQLDCGVDRFSVCAGDIQRQQIIVVPFDDRESPAELGPLRGIRHPCSGQNRIMRVPGIGNGGIADRTVSERTEINIAADIPALFRRNHPVLKGNFHLSVPVDQKVPGLQSAGENSGIGGNAHSLSVHPFFRYNRNVHPFRFDLLQQGLPHIQAPSGNRIADGSEFHPSIEFPSRMQEKGGECRQESCQIKALFHRFFFLLSSFVPIPVTGGRFRSYLNPAFSIRLGTPLAETDIACDSRIMPPCPSAKTKDALP